jgi:hypothetical protein
MHSDVTFLPRTEFALATPGDHGNSLSVSWCKCSNIIHNLIPLPLNFVGPKRRAHFTPSYILCVPSLKRCAALLIGFAFAFAGG